MYVLTECILGGEILLFIFHGFLFPYYMTGILLLFATWCIERSFWGLYWPIEVVCYLLLTVFAGLHLSLVSWESC